MKKNHNTLECGKCYWNWVGQEGCEVYNNKQNVILNDLGRCYSRVINKRQHKLILNNLEDQEVIMKGVR